MRALTPRHPGRGGFWSATCGTSRLCGKPAAPRRWGRVRRGAMPAECGSHVASCGDCRRPAIRCETRVAGLTTGFADRPPQETGRPEGLPARPAAKKHRRAQAPDIKTPRERRLSVCGERGRAAKPGHHWCGDGGDYSFALRPLRRARRIFMDSCTVPLNSHGTFQSSPQGSYLALYGSRPNYFGSSNRI